MRKVGLFFDDIIGMVHKKSCNKDLLQSFPNAELALVQ